jgi:predicted deacylase
MTGELYKRSDEALFADIGDDIVALQVERGLSYGMENVTAAVWRLLAEPNHIDAICAELTQQYDVDANVCREEVAGLLAQFEAEGLILPV